MVKLAGRFNFILIQNNTSSHKTHLLSTGAQIIQSGRSVSSGVGLLSEG